MSHYPLENNNRLEPVFIIGAGRSGTTLLYKMMCMHPEIAWISNYVSRRPALSQLSMLNRLILKTINIRRSVWFGKDSNAYVTGRKYWARLIPMPVEGESVYTHCGIPAFPEPSWCIQNDQINCLKKVFEKIRHYQSSKCFLSKRTANNRRLPQLIKAFPNAKFIHVIRDGRAVANSLINVKWWLDHKVWWWHKKTPRQWEVEGKKPIELAAMNWVKEIAAIQTGLDSIPVEQVFNIRYEELSENHASIIEKCIHFLGVDIDSDWFDEIQSIKITDNNLFWKKYLNEDEKQSLINIQQNKLQELGYR